MEFQPHAYQLRGADLLISHSGAGLFLDPGLGKTSTTLLAFNALWKESGGTLKMLIVAPIRPMYSTWPNEVKKWDDFKHLKTVVLHGQKKFQRLKEDADIYIVNPEGIPWLFEQPFRPQWDVLCIDESTRLKNSQSVRFKALKWHLGKFMYRWILTGTPAPNGLLDLFGQSFIMDSGLALGKYVTHYRKKYFYQAGYGGYEWRPFSDSLEEISALLADHTLQLNAEDYLDMPELMVVPRAVDIGRAHEHVYAPMEKTFYIELDDAKGILAANAAAAGNKCRQIANGAVYDVEGKTHEVHRAKLEALGEIVEETAGHPLLIIYEFQHDRERIMQMLGPEAVCITGMTDLNLDEAVTRFNIGHIPYLVAHAGSLHGMNIQGSCYHMVWFSLPWSLENYMQAVYRLYRQGQKSKIVFVYQLVAMGTLDERVVSVLADKRATQDSLNSAITRRRSK